MNHVAEALLAEQDDPPAGERLSLPPWCVDGDRRLEVAPAPFIAEEARRPVSRHQARDRIVPARSRIAGVEICRAAVATQRIAELQTLSARIAEIVVSDRIAGIQSHGHPIEPARLPDIAILEQHRRKIAQDLGIFGRLP